MGDESGHICSWWYGNCYGFNYSNHLWTLVRKKNQQNLLSINHILFMDYKLFMIKHIYNTFNFKYAKIITHLQFAEMRNFTNVICSFLWRRQ